MQLNQEQESPSVEYLCDYVYIDNVKLSHYYSQLSSNGLVVGSKRITKEGGKQGSSGTVKIPVLSGGMAAETTNEHSLEINIDAAFSRPQETLDALFDAGYISGGLSNSPVGALVLVKGSITLVDIRILRDLWVDMGEMVAANETASIQNIKERQRVAVQKKKEFEALAKMIAKLPHSLQGTLFTDSDAAWFTLKPECLLASADDLTFKHGSALQGEWHTLGILDALPDGLYFGSDAQNYHQLSPIEIAMGTMLNGVREGLGRPVDRYGITPIMIFRTTKKIAPESLE
ncbi:hypothetical protein GJ699_02380 [Duganella sp. FT80W]|uniref:Uncharacterized protein n=1 Tax=Duganella guangzhouensis TaxID=2666084 RepID=A0A6I2KUS0_9BURK|nr:hypothetical protein [Duganella guangzhouensis]MRW88827.1 hypothetical protein [Duganella guangzhouensis]